MAFISDKSRKDLIRRTNQSYAARKTIVAVTIAALFAFIIVSFISFYFVSKDASRQSGWEWINPDNSLTTLGIGMVVFAIIIAILGITSLVLILTIRSPKNISKEISTLESSAFSGKKINDDQSAIKLMKQRKTAKSAKNKKK